MKQCSYCNQKISFFGALFGGIDHTECNAEANKHIKSYKNVWFCNRKDIALHWIKNF